jgi:hypothetical protein
MSRPQLRSTLSMKSWEGLEFLNGATPEKIRQTAIERIRCRRFILAARMSTGIYFCEVTKHKQESYEGPSMPVSSHPRRAKKTQIRVPHHRHVGLCRQSLNGHLLCSRSKEHLCGPAPACAPPSS